MQTIRYLLLGISILNWAEVLLAEPALPNLLKDPIRTGESLLQTPKPEPPPSPPPQPQKPQPEQEPQPKPDTCPQDSQVQYLGKFPVPNDKICCKSIDIITANARKMNYPPMSITGNSTEPMKMTNTGNTGGILGDECYEYEKTDMIWANNENEWAGTTIDGEGCVVEAIGMFYNKKYKTFENALCYADGICTIRFQIAICDTDNREFPATYFEQIYEPGSSVNIQLLLSYQWYNLATKHDRVFAYRGCYEDRKTGKIYHSVTTLVIAHAATCISPRQFHILRSMKNELGERYANPMPTHPCEGPVFECEGIIQNLMYPFLQ